MHDVVAVPRDIRKQSEEFELIYLLPLYPPGILIQTPCFSDIVTCSTATMVSQDPNNLWRSLGYPFKS